MDGQAAEAAVGKRLFFALPADLSEHAGVHLPEGIHRLQLVTPGTSGHGRMVDGLKGRSVYGATDQLFQLCLELGSRFEMGDVVFRDMHS